MENRKIKVKSLISVTAWAVALGMFIAYLFLKRQWMLFTIDFAILLCCLLGISDPEAVSYTHLTLPTTPYV